MRSDCPKCYTPFEMDDWQDSKCGRYRIVWLRCPCCDFTLRDYDMGEDDTPRIGTDEHGNPLPRTPLLEIFRRYDERQAKRNEAAK